MNRKFFTLMAVAGLAGSVAANAAVTPEKVTTFPATTAAATGTDAIKVGTIVRLDCGNTTDNGWQLDFTGTPSATSIKDSLILSSASIIGRSKAHIDSLLFKVDYEKKSLDYDGTPTFEYNFTFTSKVGKFAFAKPAAGKIAGAYLKTNGALDKWVLPEAYLTDATKKYIPFVVATREEDSDKPKTVYVLAYTSDTKFKVMEIAYDDNLEGEATDFYFDVDPATGIGGALNNTTGAYTAYRIGGWIVDETAFAVSATNIKDALGYETPSFAFPANAQVSAGEENLLAAYNWEFTTEGYMKAIGAKQAVTGKALYLTVDTFFYDNANTRNYKLALDTLPRATDGIRNADAYKFDIKASFVKDSIVVLAKNTPDHTNGIFAKAAGTQMDVNANADEALIIKKFGNKTVLTTLYSGDLTAIPCLTASEFPTKELNDETVAQFTKGDVYVIYDMNKVKADKTANPDYGKALIIDNMSNRWSQIFVKAEKFDKTLPSHQWVVLKKNNINVYTFKNRETAANVSASAASGATALTDVQLFVANATEKLYTYGDRKDTIKLEKINTVSPFDGYKVISKEEQMNNVFNLRFVSELLGEEAYVQQDTDSVMKILPGNKVNAAEIRLLDVASYYRDTTKLGVEGFELTTIPYAVKIGRYFLTYDADKKVYRFTTKQWNEANGEEVPNNYYTLFYVTKLVGGNIALVPNYTVENSGYSQDKLAIDSENGKAVRVALDSDLRHTFELTAPVDRIFAQVLPKADSTLVDVAFHSVENLGWKVAKGEDNFIYEGVPSLKAGGAEYDKAAFNFKLDTAYVQRSGNTMPLYYITYNAARHDSLPVAHIHDNGKDHVCPAPLVNDTVSGQFLFIMSDSLGISRANDLKYGYTYNNDDRYAKLQFINAKHINDTLIVNPGRPVAMSMDTLKAGKIDKNARPEQIQTQWLGEYNNNAQFAFRVNMDNKNEYAIYNPATGLYITYLNGFVVASPDASFYTLKDINGGSVDNEKIEDAASAISVTAKAGAVEIAGAAGKRVVISNVLGQVIANTVIASDDATIAAPAGIVVVAVEGEAAVKAIVK